MAVFGITQRGEQRPVPGFGGKYSVAEDGSVWRDGSMLVPVRGIYVSLSYKGEMRQTKIAYLVARAFLPNAEGRPFVRHKDGDPTNNRVENLEWSEEKERKRRGGRAVRESVSVWRADNGELVGSWGSVEEACRALGVDERSVRRQLRGGAKSVKGLIFKV